MAQVISHQSLNSEAQIDTGDSPCGICGGQIGTGTGFSLCSAGLPCQYHSTMALHTHI
jgi:hypothetical protein